MSSIRYAFHFLPAVIILLFCLVKAPAQTPFYTLTDLGTFPSNNISYGTAVNNTGQIAGYGYTASSGPNAFFSAVPGSLQSLSTLPGGTSSHAFGINSSGQVAGYSSTNAADGATHAFLSGVNGGSLKDLGVLPGGYESEGFAVNDEGQVAGFSDTTYSQHAFLSGINGGALQDLGTLGGPLSFAFGLNNQGQVTGYSTTQSYTHAFLFSDGVMKDLGTLTGNFSAGLSVNMSGQVTGYADTNPEGGDQHAFLSGANGGPITDLGVLPGGNQSIGYGINAQGQVVGESRTAGGPGPGPNHAFLYSNGMMTDLNDLISPTDGFVLQGANSISDTGLIVGTGMTASGKTHAFLLTPAAVPEASSLVSTGILLTLGMGAFVLRSRKRTA